MICSVLAERDWRFGEVQRDNSLFLQFFLQKASLGLVPQGSCYCLRLPPVGPTNQRPAFWRKIGGKWNCCHPPHIKPPITSIFFCLELYSKASSLLTYFTVFRILVSLTRQPPLTSHAGFTAAAVAIPAKLKRRRMGYFNPYLNMTFYTPTKVIALRRHEK